MCGGGSPRSLASPSPSHFIHRAVMPDGGCLSLFKVLMTNICINDCAYCINSSRRDIPRTSFQPGELAQLFMDYQYKRLVSGLFLSSGIAGNPDFTMERMIQTVEILRRRYQFKGYIHLKYCQVPVMPVLRQPAGWPIGFQLTLRLPLPIICLNLARARIYMREFYLLCAR